MPAFVCLYAFRRLGSIKIHHLPCPSLLATFLPVWPRLSPFQGKWGFFPEQNLPAFPLSPIRTHTTTWTRCHVRPFGRIAQPSSVLIDGFLVALTLMKHVARATKFQDWRLDKSLGKSLLKSCNCVLLGWIERFQPVLSSLDHHRGKKLEVFWSD